jgi:hypothetical protein
MRLVQISTATSFSTSINYKDDIHCLRELLLYHNRNKSELLSKHYKALEREYSLHQTSPEKMTQSVIANKSRLEMTDDRFPSFVDCSVDRIFHDGYSDFNTNTPLLPDQTMIEIYEQIKKLFPMHHRPIHSILFGVRSHQPARATEHPF